MLSSRPTDFRELFKNEPAITKRGVMKKLITTIAILVLFVACASKQEKSDNASASAPTNQAVAGNAEKPAQGNATPTTKGDEKTEGRPVELTSLGIAADKEHVAYKIKVNTDKPISQVDIELKYTDEKGKVETETLIWQNIVKSTRQPIEKGKTYEDQSYLSPGSTKAECKLKRVVFEDGTSWSPK